MPRQAPQKWFRQAVFGARSLIGVVPVLMTTGCSAVDVVNALVPRDGYQVVRDIPYGEGSRRRLDIYVPDGVINAPVVVFFYGGSWREGSKAQYLFMGQALAAKGFVTVIPDYRVYPDVRFPGFLDDSASAVRWVHDHVAEHGGDPKKIALMGHSAGAYLAVMLAVNPHYFGEVGLDPARDIKAVVGLAGPYDFLPLQDPVLKIIFGPEDQLAATQPINFVTSSAPPMLLAAGNDDTTVYPRNSTHLAARLREVGVAADERHYSGLNHMTLIGAMAAPLRFLAPVQRDVVSYLNQVLAVEKSGSSS